VTEHVRQRQAQKIVEPVDAVANVTLHQDAPPVTSDVGTVARVDLWGIWTMTWLAVLRDRK